MTEVHSMLSTLRRPRLLIRAARFGMGDYRRERDLKRLIHSDRPVGPESAVPRLLSEEDRLEQTRKAGDASYSLARHIEVLIALLCEARLLPRDARS